MPVWAPRYEMLILFIICKAKPVAVLFSVRCEMAASTFMTTQAEPKFKYEANEHALAGVTLASHLLAQPPCLDVAFTPSLF